MSPITIGRVPLTNRIVMPAMATRMSADGSVSEAEVAWGVERAQGGASLIVAGGIHVHPTSLPSGNPGRQVEAWRDDTLASHKARVDAIHRAGAKVFAQLAHTGREAIMEQIGPRMEQPLLAPSAIRSPGAEWAPREMDESDIREIVASFGCVAAQLADAGYDGIEIHAGHGYLVAQFLSLITNNRTDEYGVSTMENRARFLTQILQDVRHRCGDQLTVGVRFSAVEEVPGGITIDDTKRIVEIVETTSNVDYLSFTVGIRGAYVKDNSTSPGFAVPHAAAVRSVTSLPLVIAGRINSPDLGERILEQGAADLIGMARALIADPALPDKVRTGRTSSIRPCLGFSQECRLTRDGITCGVNARAGRESTEIGMPIKRHDDVRRLLIAGGGPAGMEAARVAAKAGYRVILLEAASRLGGQLRRAARQPFRADFDEYADYLEREIREANVDIRIETPATPRLIDDESPDAIIIATGSRPSPLLVPHADATVPVISTWELFDGKNRELGPTILVADDGSGFWPVCGAADLLATTGAHLEFITPNAVIGRSIPHESLTPLHRRLRAAGVTYSTFTTLVSVEGRTATLADTISGEQRTIDVDAVVVQVPNAPVTDLIELERGDVPVATIGDSFAPRRLSYATLEAHRAINSLGRPTPESSAPWT